MLPLTYPSEDEFTKLMIDEGGRTREAEIKAQSADGKVYLQYEGDQTQSCVDLSKLRYNWVGSDSATRPS
jgi:hypothetical protein